VYEETITTLRTSQERGPETTLLLARALIGAGRGDEAGRELSKLAQAPLLEPEQRAGAAELLMDLGQHELALVQAELAFDVDPRPPFVRLVLAAACTRVWRRSFEPALMTRAAGLLSGVRARESHTPALVYALRASVQAAIGDPERVVGLSQRALSLDPHCADALAAVAIASAKLGRTRDAQHAYLRLQIKNETEARVVARELTRLGVPLTGVEIGSNDVGYAVSDVWDEIDLALVDGERSHVLGWLEAACKSRLSEATASSASVVELARLAAEQLTTLPIWRHFAPFDFSLWSLPRLDAALALLYGSDLQLRPALDSPLRLLLAGYWGETLRRTRGGQWPAASSTRDALMRAEFGDVRPFHALAARLERGEPIELPVMPELSPEDPGVEPWFKVSATPESPPAPWDPEPWPDPSDMQRLGRALERSVVCVYCQSDSFGPLDRSLTSLGALDAYVSLIAPLRAPRNPDAPWCRRAAVLLGAYVGEVLAQALGGEWQPHNGPVLDERSYRIVLRSDQEATPVAQLLARLCGRTAMSVVEYAEKLARRSDDSQRYG
jgi:tetratricopeptide (TPR) repeat protein